MPDSKGEYLQADATAELTAELDSKMRSLYPVMSEHGVSREAFLLGDVSHVSITIPTDRERNPQFREQLVTLLRAANNPTHPAYSEHGALHATYNETLGMLINEVQNGTFKIEVQPTRIRIGTQRKTEVLTNRYILQASEARERITYRPRPHQTANEIVQKEHDEKSRIRKVKQLIREHGTGFGILVLAYMRPDEKTILDFFNNKDFKKELESLGQKAPSLSRSTDKQMVADICNTLVVKKSVELMASPSPEKYKDVVDTLRKHGYLPKDYGEKEIFGFDEVRDIVLPKAVFIGADTTAQELAPEELENPKRTKYIEEKYGRGITSILATAFLENL